MSRPAEPTHKITGKIIRETDKALQMKCETIDGNEWSEDSQQTNWFPISQISTISRAGSMGNLPDSITINRWILQQKELV